MIIIFWDYDGTLVDSETIYRNALNNFIKENKIGKKEIENDYFYKNISGRYPNVFIKKLKVDG